MAPKGCHFYMSPELMITYLIYGRFRLVPFKNSSSTILVQAAMYALDFGSSIKDIIDFTDKFKNKSAKCVI